MTLFFHPGDLGLIPLLFLFILIPLLVLAVFGWLIWGYFEFNSWTARKKEKLDKDSKLKKSK